MSVLLTISRILIMMVMSTIIEDSDDHDHDEDSDDQLNPDYDHSKMIMVVMIRNILGDVRATHDHPDPDHDDNDVGDHDQTIIMRIIMVIVIIIITTPNLLVFLWLDDEDGLAVDQLVSLKTVLITNLLVLLSEMHMCG